MTDDGPTWREITTDTYFPRAFADKDHSAAWIAAERILADLLDQQLEGTLRLRVVLRATVDLKPQGKRDPLWIGDYRTGPDTVFAAAEVVIETRDGKRHPVMVRPT